MMMMMRWPARIALALIALACARATAATSAYDPCSTAGSSSIALKDSLTIGIAYWPGGTLGDWADAHPCANKTALAARGVGTTVYLVDADGMTAVRGTRADEDGLYAAQATATMMSVVAYTATTVSAPRAIRVASGSAGDDGRTGRVSVLTLLATLDKGDVKYLRWHNAGCGECGGNGNERCLSVGAGDYACTASEAACDGTCTGAACDVELGTTDALRCQLTVTVALSGTDVNEEVFEYGAQLERLSRYSSSGAYSSAAAKATSTTNGVLGFFGR